MQNRVVSTQDMGLQSAERLRRPGKGVCKMQNRILGGWDVSLQSAERLRRPATGVCKMQKGAEEMWGRSGSLQRRVTGRGEGALQKAGGDAAVKRRDGGGPGTRRPPGE